jgi:hypothetical protein
LAAGFFTAGAAFFEAFAAFLGVLARGVEDFGDEAFFIAALGLADFFEALFFGELAIVSGIALG